MNKMKLLIGLLALGVILLGGGILFLLLSPQQTGTKVMLTPLLGSYLMNSQNESSQVLLQTVKIEKSVIGQPNVSSWPMTVTVNAKPGDPILIISGSVLNNHPSNKEITMYAEGYNTAGKKVALTLDEGSVSGIIGFHLETGESGTFTLHLNYSADIKSIHIFANNYDQVPP